MNREGVEKGSKQTPNMVFIPYLVFHQARLLVLEGEDKGDLV
jgi:hypothetical protein